MGGAEAVPGNDLLVLYKTFPGYHVSHGAARIHPWEYNRLMRRKYGCALSHEVDAAEHYNLFICLRGFDAKPERVACKVCRLLYLVPLIVVGKEDRITLHKKLSNIGFKFSHSHEFKVILF